MGATPAGWERYIGQRPVFPGSRSPTPRRCGIGSRRIIGRTTAVWLVTFKAVDRARYVSRGAVLDALIAYGWIDGRRMTLDETRTMQLISKRRTQDWTASYRARAERLIAAGRMQPPGLRVVEVRAQEWALERPPGCRCVGDPVRSVGGAGRPAGAAEWFEAAAPSYRRNVLRWIAKAKRPETRTKRLAATAVASAKGEKIPQM